jgi:hypothetical protein
MPACAILPVQAFSISIGFREWLGSVEVDVAPLGEPDILRRMQRIFFYATPDDIAPALSSYEANAPLKFVQMGNLTTPNRAIYLSSTEIPRLGVSSNETGGASEAYMVSHRDTKNHLHAFVGRSGEKRWVLDNSDNEETTIITPAGLWNGIIVQGVMDTLHTKNPAAQQLMKWLVSAFKINDFAKIDSAWVGPHAMTMLMAGKRLSQAEQSPPEYDLCLPQQ